MSTFKPRLKRISLAFMGEGWAECYLDFKALTWADVAGLQEQAKDESNAVQALLSVLERNFVRGQALGTDDEIFTVEAYHLKDLDLESLTRISERLGGTDPNA